MTIYETVKYHAQRCGKTIRGLEREAGLSSNSIGKWRDHSPRVESLVKVSEALDISPMELIRSAVKKDD